MVKEYTYLAGNILISLVCSRLYPDKFEFDGFIIFSLALLFLSLSAFPRSRSRRRPPSGELFPAFPLISDGVTV